MDKLALDLIMITGKIHFDRLCGLVGYAEAYAYRCVQCEYTMRYSEYMLDLAASIHGSNERVRNYIIHHVEEEKGHHNWAVSDLINLRSIQDCNWPISPYSMISIARTIDQIKSGNILYMIGYAIAVECYQGTLIGWNSFIEMSGLPRGVFKNALSHAEIDVIHSRELLELVQFLPVPAQKEVWRSAIEIGLVQLRSFQWASDFYRSGLYH